MSERKKRIEEFDEVDSAVLGCCRKDITMNFREKVRMLRILSAEDEVEAKIVIYVCH
jgi:hypothetical protein